MAPPDNKHSAGDPDPIRELLDERNLADEISRAIEGNDCPSQAELEAYVQKELKEPERIEVKSHLTFCSKCRKKIDEITSGNRPGLAGIGEPAAEAPRRRRPSPTPEAVRSRVPLVLTLVGLALVASGGLAYFFWFRGGPPTFPYTGKVVYADAKRVLRSGRPFFYELRTPEPIYLLEITIDGEGRIASRMSGGTANGQFSDGHQIQINPQVPGEFDLYLLPCPAKGGFPDRLLADLQKFLNSDTALSRENQRTGIEVAIKLYHAEFLHQVFRIEP